MTQWHNNYIGCALLSDAMDFSSDAESVDAVDAVDGFFLDVSLSEIVSEKALQCAICFGGF